ncbi:Uroporphyrin-III C/tetrapyrrole (Corrin/Porphyrin) methyltransferase [Segniliparus rotundus DSM 44985]|uniref:Ribosomal RNA small subunit methyltransferase I n=1 Tax=Segniliparus rotundus (strain ATCC BAA-972 / CDC 1076 / CIP 108378 / DSM 44985 / JCM 13578) TaxID=640132 RepID=D6ZA25_SEGRD|nr:16S rRNA (cytidine(1402)-2'-O)-methyltransferase [Segniliparus rotundus]ADG98695.1 Uroporphyrin-III C/tetrapyrrole (Corrin/Porphyrin) methyltransferase [Segniliparus rotundus DSM 44985]
MLVLGATPLGNPADASQRLKDVLASADVVAAEDTRRAKDLARALGVRISGRLVSFHDHAEERRIEQLVSELRDGRTVLVVSDAGTPLVNDPGFRLVRAVVAQELPVTCLPGPSAVTAALALSGLATDRFCFEGFAPRKSQARRAWFAQLRSETRTCVFFEAPHRIADCLRDAVAELGADRPAAVCRELTKTYEEVRRGSLADLAAWAADGLRGEITVVLGAAEAAHADMAALVRKVEQFVAAGARFSETVSLIAAEAGIAKRELYAEAVAARGETG